MSRLTGWPREEARLIRRLLLSANERSGGTQRTLSPTKNLDPIRRSASICGISAARDIDRYWKADRAQEDGPIDVMDVFSGCGGMSAGFQAANAILPAFRLALALDIDDVANASYEANLGLKPAKEDVSVLAGNKKRLSEIIKSSGLRDGHPLIMIGCAPCQGFSSHRNKGGQDDPRNSLFMDFIKIATLLRPTAVVIENVPELLTTASWPYVRAARRLLTRHGYSVHLTVHNMAEFSTPQERYRAVMVAVRKRTLPPRGFLDRPRFRTVRDAIGRLPRVSAGQRLPSDAMHYSASHRESTLATIRAVPKDGGCRPVDREPQSLKRIKERQGRAAYEDVYGRLWWDRPAITITAYARNPASGRFIHPEQDRGLTVREAAILQGFPMDYSFAGTFDQRFRQIGNAVPPNFAAFLALHLLGEILGPEPAPGDVDGGLKEPVGSSFSRVIPALKAGHRKVVSSTVSP